MRAGILWRVAVLLVSSAAIVAQTKPTDAKVISLVTTYVTAHRGPQMPELPIAAGMTGDFRVRAVKILRWGEFQDRQKYWPVEVCVAVSITPTFGGTVDASTKVRFGLSVDDFGDAKVTRLAPPDGADLHCDSGLPAPTTSGGNGSSAPSNAPPPSPRAAGLAKIRSDHPASVGVPSGIFHLHVPTAVAAATSGGDSVPPSCFGVLFVEDGMLRFISTDATDGQLHTFKIEQSKVSELKTNYLPIGRFRAFHVNSTDKQNINFATLFNETFLDNFIASTKGKLGLR